MIIDTTKFEELFRQIGVELGRELAAHLLASGEVETAPAQPAPATGAAARILPGLTGRRRRAGEAPPRCGRAGCNKASRTRGYCQTHYVQWLKAGEQRQAG